MEFCVTKKSETITFGFGVTQWRACRDIMPTSRIQKNLSRLKAGFVIIHIEMARPHINN